MANKKPYTYAILGTGALGGFYGMRLAAKGKEVHFILHSDYEHVKEKGLLMESIDGDINLPDVNAYGDPSKAPKCDVVCVALKSTQNHLLPTLLPPLVGEDTVVLIMQNGLGVEEEAARIVPQAKIAGGLCYLCSNKVGPGHIRHLDYGQLSIGNHKGVDAETLESIRSDFEEAGVPAVVEDNLQRARWKKLVWNIPYNGLTVVLGTTTDKIMANPKGRLLVRELMEEVLAGAKACDAEIDPGYVDEMLSFTDAMTPYNPSMKLDHDAGNPMEIEYLYRKPLAAAREAGAELLRIGMLEKQLSFLNAAG